MFKSLKVAAVLFALSTPAFAQKADIEKANARFVELFNKGDFAGMSGLYAPDAVALPPDAGIVKGRACNLRHVEGHREQSRRAAADHR
jgi:ketosteroid isomerase-like protein